MNKSPTLQDLCAVVSQHAECLAELASELNCWWPEPQQFWKGHVELDAAFCGVTLRTGPATIQSGVATGHEASPEDLLRNLACPAARILVRGDSGAGKSMLGQWLALRSLQEMRRREEIFDTESRDSSVLAVFPLVVSLADYVVAAQQPRGFSLDEFVLQHATERLLPSSIPDGMRTRAERLAREHWTQGRTLVVLEDFESALLADERFTSCKVAGVATIRNRVRKFIDDLPARHSLLVLSRAGWPEEWPAIEHYGLQPLAPTQRQELLACTIFLAGQHLNVDTTAVLSDLENGVLGDIHGDEWLKRASASPEIVVFTATLAVERVATGLHTPPLVTGVYGAITGLKLQRWSERWRQCPPVGLRRSSLGKDVLDLFVHNLASNPAQAPLTVFTADADSAALNSADFQTKLRALLDDSSESHGEWQELLTNLQRAVLYDSGFLVCQHEKVVFQTPGMRRFLANAGGDAPAAKPALGTVVASEVRRVALAFAADQLQKLRTLITRSAEGRVPPSGRIAGHDEAIPPLIPRLEIPPKKKRRSGSGIVSPSSRSTLEKDAIRYLARVRDSLCLVGDAGAGKSIAMMMSAREICERLLQRRWLYRWVPMSWWRCKVPIFVALGRFTRSEAQLHLGHVREYVREELVRTYGPEYPILPMIDHLEAAGMVVWIFDAVDEVSRNRHGDHVQALSDFANATEHLGNHCLFSCRKKDLTIFNRRRVSLTGLDEAQVAQFLEERLSSDITIDHKPYKPLVLAKELCSGKHAAFPEDSVGNPFLLKLFCAYVVRFGNWPASRVIMLKAYLEAAFLNKARERPTAPADLDEMHRLFAELARIAHRISELGDGPFAPLHRLYDGTPQDCSRLVGVIETARRCGILAVPAPDEVDELVGFEHHRYDEFFSALHLHRASENIDWMDKLESPRWLEIMQNLILLGVTGTEGTSSASAMAVQVLRDSLMHDAEEHEAIVAARTARGTALSESDYAGDLLDFEREFQWAFRTEVAARIVGQASGAIASVRDRLTPATRRSLEFLITYGTDATKVRLALVAVHLPANSEPLKALDRMSVSSCNWVRDHDFELMVTSPAYRQLSEGRPDIHCVALSELRFIAHSKKAKAALEKRPDEDSIKNWQRARLIYWVQSTGLVLLLILMAFAGPFFPTYWRWGPQWWEPVNSAFGWLSPYWISIVFGISCVLGMINRPLDSFGSWFKRAWAARSISQPWEWESLDSWFEGALAGGLVFYHILGLALTLLMTLALFDFSLSYFVVWLVLYGLVYFSLKMWRYAAVLWRAFTVWLLCELSSSPTESGTHLSSRKYLSNVWRSNFPGQSLVHYIWFGCSISSFLGVFLLPLIFPVAVQHREQLDASITGTAQQVGHFLAAIWHGVATPARPLTETFASLWRDIADYFSRSEEEALKRFQHWAELLRKFDLSLSGHTLQAIFSWAVSILVFCLPLGSYFVSRKRASKTASTSKPTNAAKSRSTSVLAQIGWLVLWLASLPVLFATFSIAAKSKAPAIPYASAWMTIIVGLAIGYFVEKDARQRRASGMPSNPRAEWIRRMWFGVSVGLVAGTIFIAKRKPVILPAPSKGLISIILVLGGIAVAGLLVLLLRDGFRNSLIAWRKYRIRRGEGTPLGLDEWLNRVRNGAPKEQLKLIQHNLDRLCPNTEELLKALRSVRSAIKAEPARSPFAEKMHQVLEKWRHEKMTKQEGH